MGGIYFHIPFCRRKCLYCNFFSTADVRRMPQMCDAMRRELIDRAASWPHRDVRTVYFGGGTPSLLPAEDIAMFLAEVRRSFRLADDAEVTVEANPEDLSPEKAARWRHAGVNRVSLGVQSFDDAALAFMGRRHSGADAVRAVETLRSSGFENLTIDLIYGIPGRSDDVLRSDVGTALGLGVRHVSAYALTVEPGTALDVLIGRKRLPAPDDEDAARQYGIVTALLEKAGMERYEVSNFAFPGYRSRHNSSYWSGVPYLGIGPSAHSFDGRAERRWNAASAGGYIAGAEKGAVPFESERLSEKDLHNEAVMTALRTCEGLSLTDFARRFGPESRDRLLRGAQQYIDRGQAEIVGGTLRITPAGVFFTDGISAHLFAVD